MKSHFNIEKERQEQDGTEWVFGAFSQPDIAPVPLEERIKYLPKGEVQHGVEDFMDCASRGPINILEIKFNWLLANKKLLPENEKWLRDNGYIDENGITFSDRFIAIKSGTTRDGNSIKAPLEAIRKHGLIPKRVLPASSSMTFDQYHDKSAITGSLEALGQAFLRRFKINYEKVFEIHYEEANKNDPLNVAGFAWPAKKGDIYPRAELPPNHVWVNLFPKYTAFDNYLDTDGDFIKQLAEDYDFYEYGYRIYISAQYLPSNQWLVAEILSNIWQLFFPLKEKVEEIAPLPIKTKPMTNREKFIQVCLDALDTRVSPDNPVPDDVSCAVDISRLVKKIFPDFKEQTSTKILDFQLFKDNRFERLTEPKKGAIIMSPAKTDSKGNITTYGHCGVFITDDRIASNNSFGVNKGKFTGNYSWDSWIKEFKDKRGLSIYIYQLKE